MYGDFEYSDNTIKCTQRAIVSASSLQVHVIKMRGLSKLKNNKHIRLEFVFITQHCTEEGFSACTRFSFLHLDSFRALIKPMPLPACFLTVLLAANFPTKLCKRRYHYQFACMCEIGRTYNSCYTTNVPCFYMLGLTQTLLGRDLDTIHLKIYYVFVAVNTIDHIVYSTSVAREYGITDFMPRGYTHIVCYIYLMVSQCD